MRVRPWLLPMLVGTAATLAGAIAGIAGGPIGTASFAPQTPLDELWVRLTMPAEFAARGAELGVARWTADATFVGETIWAEERAMTLGPMTASGGFLNPEEAIDVWRFRAGWPFRWVEMSSWGRGSVLVDRDVWTGNPFGIGRSGGLPGIPVGIRVAPLAGTLALHSAVAWAALVVPFELRRRRRRERGACVECGHPLANAVRCPECGAEAAPSGRSGPEYHR